MFARKLSLAYAAEITKVHCQETWGVLCVNCCCNFDTCVQFLPSCTTPEADEVKSFRILCVFCCHWSNCLCSIVYWSVIGWGFEYPAVVEFAPFLKVPKKRAKKPDPRKGTIESGRSFMLSIGCTEVSTHFIELCSDFGERERMIVSKFQHKAN